MTARTPTYHLVGVEEWNEKVIAPGKTIYPDIYAALQFLKESPVGTRVKVSGGSDPVKKRHRLGTYADRFGVLVRTHVADGWIYFCSTGRKETKAKG
jgi:hypothetical protein